MLHCVNHQTVFFFQNGWTTLHDAAIKGNAEMVAYMMERVNPNVDARDVRTTVHLVYMYNYALVCAHVCVCMCVCVCVYACLCMRAWMCICICVIALHFSVLEQCMSVVCSLCCTISIYTLSTSCRTRPH